MNCNFIGHNAAKANLAEANDMAWYVTKCFTYDAICVLYERYGWRETAFKVMCHTVHNFNSYIEDEHYNSALICHEQIATELEQRNINFVFRSKGGTSSMREQGYYCADLMISCLLLELNDRWSWRDVSGELTQTLRTRADKIIRRICEGCKTERESVLDEARKEYERLGFLPLNCGMSTYGDAHKLSGYKLEFNKPQPKIEKPKPTLEDASIPLFRTRYLLS